MGMDQVAQSIIGWDLGEGGGENARELPCDPVDLVLYEAKPTFDPAEGYPPSILIDIWGFDPRLNVSLYFSRVPNPSIATPFDYFNVVGVIFAYTLTRSRGNVITGKLIPNASLFSNGGNLSDQDDDGCEIQSGVQGIRFYIQCWRTGATSHDVVLQAQAKPNVSLGCPDLAKKLISQLTVNRHGPPRSF